MSKYEYKVVAAPRKTRSFKGVRRHEDQFAAVLAEAMNDLAGSGWEYLRAESLPCEEKTGLTSRVESYQSVLVFRREIVADQKFFETPPTRQIELHKIDEDTTEKDFVFTSSHRAASATVTPLHSTNAESTSNVTTQAGVLGILRSRKARLMRSESAEPSSATSPAPLPEAAKHAAE